VDEPQDKSIEKLAQRIEDRLTIKHGTTLLGGEALWKELGYPSVFAFRKALSRNKVPVKVFKIENRRGNFALVREVANWLAEQSIQP